jgi:predicted TIM-barrel fold metal-dependent hydrolase
MSMAASAIDCHAHVVDPAQFAFADGPGYRPKAHEIGTAEDYVATLTANGVGQALLVQPSGYGFDNSAMLDAMRRFPGRFRAIAVLDDTASDRVMAEMSDAGVVGVRFNLLSYDRDALNRPAAGRFLDRIREHGWYVQIFADGDQWPALAEFLRPRRMKVLIDHFGFPDVSAGAGQAGFSAVLALGREGGAAVKLSAPFRISRMPAPYADLDPFAEALIAAFGLERCVWGSDWPFLDCAAPVDYAQALAALRRWLPDADDRDQVLRRTPAALFGFGEAP